MYPPTFGRRGFRGHNRFPALTLNPCCPERYAGDTMPVLAGEAMPRRDSLPSGSKPPANIRGKFLEEIDIIGPFWRLPDFLVDPMGILADKNPPPIGLDASQNDGRRLRSGGGGFLQEASCPLTHHHPHVVVGQGR